MHPQRALSAKTANIRTSQALRPAYSVRRVGSRQQATTRYVDCAHLDSIKAQKGRLLVSHAVLALQQLHLAQPNVPSVRLENTKLPRAS